MIRRSILRTAARLAAAAAAICLNACPGEGETGAAGDVVYLGESFSVRSGRGETMPSPSRPLPALTPLPAGAVPWAGTVSHHLLAAELIDAWFKELKRSRDVGLFIIISPRHWEQGVREISLSGLPWDTGRGLVTVDQEALGRLRRELETAEDPFAFPGEHGVDAFLPFIQKHFPRAQVLPVIVAMTGIRIETGLKLARALEAFFSGEEAKRCFLLVSADFSHHGNAAETAVNDAASRRFQETLSPAAWAKSVCDNKLGLFAVQKLAEKSGRGRCAILCRTDSFTLTGQEPADITSYFFSFFY